MMTDRRVAATFIRVLGRLKHLCRVAFKFRRSRTLSVNKKDLVDYCQKIGKIADPCGPTQGQWTGQEPFVYTC